MFLVASFSVAGILAVCVLLLSGCGAGAPLVAASGLGIVQHENGKVDNPVFPVSPGHPMRIAFLRSVDNAAGELYAVDSNGGNYKLVTTFSKGGGESFEPKTPAASQNGLRFYLATDYFATSTDIISVEVDGYRTEVVERNPINIEEPAISWDGKKMAFVGYTSRDIAVLVKPSERDVDSDSSAQVGISSSGLKLSTGGTLAGVGFTGNLGSTAPTDCSTQTYSSTVSFITIKAKFNFTFWPVGNYICEKLDDTNYLILHFTDYNYPFLKDKNVTCSSTSDCKTSTCANVKTCESSCSNDNVCDDGSGGFTSIPCDDDSDCASGICNTDSQKYCVYDTGEQASLSFHFSWPAGSYASETAGDSATTIKDTVSETGSRSGAGVDLVKPSFQFRKYDLYSVNLDGTGLTQHTDDDAPDRFPCFSPTSSDEVYYSAGVLDTKYMDYDTPASFEITKINLSTGVKTSVLSTGSTYLDRNCAFSPSGNLMAFSRYSGTDYDLYLHNFNDDTTSLLVDTSSAITTAANDLYPTFSPLGDAIAFQSDETIDYDIYVTDLSGENVVNITNNDTNIDDTSPAWAP